MLITNIDDVSCKELLSINKGQNITFGINNDADYKAINITFDDNGCASFDVGDTHIKLNVKGLHNVYNSLAAIALADPLGIYSDITLKTI